VPVDGLRDSKEFPLRQRALEVIEAGWNEARKCAELFLSCGSAMDGERE